MTIPNTRKYYTMESVRDLIVGKYEVKSTGEASVPLPDWNMCRPCKSLCRNKRCTGYVSIFIPKEISEKYRTPSNLYLEIIFSNENKRGFIDSSSRQMEKLIEFDMIDKDNLVIEELYIPLNQ